MRSNSYEKKKEYEKIYLIINSHLCHIFIMR
ncbi:hypothetical protein SAMN05216364_103118 [Porphyromonadaceae bacterium KHP3R9]|nr:hypothetical protein SAMN05216364_103118 [Porphyromonadaceae bacterium KHP3R9]